MELRDLGGAVWRHKLLVVLILALTAAGVAAGLYFAPKTYSATATVSAAATDSQTAGADDLDALRGTLAELAGSADVLSEVGDRLTVPRSQDQLRREVSGAWIDGTVLVQVTVEDSDPRVAAEIANAVADVLPQHDPSGGAFTFTTTNPARPPLTYSSPNLLLAIGAGTVLGLILALCGALLRDRRGTTLVDAKGAAESAAAPVLAHVFPPRDPTTLPALSPGTAAAAVFRHLRIALEAEASAEPTSKIVVTGVTAGDVNVWLGANLAISLATVGRRVLLVDGRIGDRYGRPIAAAPDTAGLYELLTGADFDAALSPGPVENLTVVPAGDWGGEPTDTLIETRFSDAMAEAAERFDVVVILAPPLDACDDARVMASGGSLLLAVPEGAVPTAELHDHAAQIRSVGIRLLGLVLVSRRAERTSA